MFIQILYCMFENSPPELSHVRNLENQCSKTLKRNITRISGRSRTRRSQTDPHVKRNLDAEAGRDSTDRTDDVVVDNGHYLDLKDKA